MDYPDVTSWRPGGERSRPEPPREPHQAQTLAAPAAPGPVAADPGARPAGDDPLGWASEELVDIPPAKPRSLTPTRLLTIAILIALAFLGGVYVQKQHTYGYTPPAEAPKEFVPHGH